MELELELLQVLYCERRLSALKIARELGYADGQMPKSGLVFDKEPCDKCKEWMKQGIILISVDESKSEDMQDPYRTGNFCVVKDDAIRRMLAVDIPEGIDPEICHKLGRKQKQNQELLEHVLKARVCFIPDDAWKLLGLPTTNISEKEKIEK